MARRYREKKDSDDLLHDITKNIPAVVFQFYAKDTGEYGISYASERLAELFGISCGLDEMFDTFVSLLHEEDKARFLVSVKEAVDSCEPWSFEGRFVHQKGNVVWVHGMSTPERRDDRTVFSGILLDITRDKLNEELLEKKVRSLTSPLDDTEGIGFADLFNLEDIQRLQDQFAKATGVASIITHTDGTPITAPSNFCRLCGEIIRKTKKGLANCYKSDSIIGQLSTKGPAVQTCLSCGFLDAGAGISVGGRHIANWLIGQVRDESQTEESVGAYARAIGADEAAFIEAFNEVPNMPKARFQSIAEVLFTLANQLSTLAYQNVQQARFITERRKATEERKRLEQQLAYSQRMDAIGQLAGGIAHDINNILMGIQGNASLMLMHCPSGDPCHDGLIQIEEHVKRGANLTRQLLGFARGGKYEVKTLSINALIRKSAQLFLETRKEIQAVFNLPDDVCPVDVDEGQIEQVFLNIFINAWHAMPHGGTLTIETANNTFTDPEASAFEIPPGRYVRVSISDTGTGMDKKTLNRIFEPFYTTRAANGGTGLGLASAYGIVRNHGGAITAQSEPGKGAQFIIYLPSSVKPIERIEERKKTNLDQGHGGILIVDDERLAREPAARFLTMMGYSVSTAGSGDEALRLYENSHGGIDLVILDMIMPGMSGTEVLKQLKERDPRIRVLISSGYGFQGEVQLAMEMGCCGFIQKPYNFTDLSHLVRQALQGEHSPDA